MSACKRVCDTKDASNVIRKKVGPKVRQRNFLANPECPVSCIWPTLKESRTTRILKDLRKLLKELKLCKTNEKMLQKKLAGKKLTHEEKMALKAKIPKKVWNKCRVHRVHLTLGLSETIRYIQKKELCAVLLCRNVNPAIMLDSILPFCSFHCPCAAAIPALGLVLKERLRVKSCRAIGFKKTVASDESNVFHPFYLMLKDQLPPLPRSLYNWVTEVPGNPVAVVKAEEVKAKPSGSFPKKDYSHLYIKKADVEQINREQKEVVIVSNHAHNLTTEPDAPSRKFVTNFVRPKFKQLKLLLRMNQK